MIDNSRRPVQCRTVTFCDIGEFNFCDVEEFICFFRSKPESASAGSGFLRIVNIMFRITFSLPDILAQKTIDGGENHGEQELQERILQQDSESVPE